MAPDTHNSVSVVLPCYNGQDYITQALDSAVAQTHRPIDIIVVDDGSSDNSTQIVIDYTKSHPGHHIRLIMQENAGEPTARNTGIKASKGAWVAMLDADDWWEPTKLEKQLAAAKEAGPDCVLVHTGNYSHLPDGTTTQSDLSAAARRSGWCTEALLETTSIGHPSIMVRRDVLNKIGGYDESYKQACDIDLYFRLSIVGTFVFVPEYLLNYRKHANQMSASQVDQIRYHHRAVQEFFSKHPDTAEQIGKDTIEAALARHVSVKLGSLYWKRRLQEFRRLLKYAKAQRINSPEIQNWSHRSRMPNWMIHLKDRLSSPRN